MIENIEVQLPFYQNNNIRISQGFHGPWSHYEISPVKDLTYSVDFAVPLGTLVIAAREGRVAAVFDQSSRYYDGKDPKIGNSLVFEDTNFILVQHNDQTIAVYSHLAKGSHLVNMRQDIKAGQPLAKTGLSGWVGPIPHLHFQIFKAKDRKSVPFKFREYPGSLEHGELEKDIIFTS